MKRSLVLLSSGLDSTVNLYSALAESVVVLALTFDYGQRAATREIEHARDLAATLGIPHKVLALPWFRDFTRTSLVDSDQAVPTDANVGINDFELSTASAKAVWVPNRNGIFLNIAAAFAEGLNADWIIPGFNREEAVTFPDNSAAFLEATTRSLDYSTSNHVAVKCFTTELDKIEIVKLGRKLNVPFHKVWACYFGGEAQCGSCESCQRFARAMAFPQDSASTVESVAR